MDERGVHWCSLEMNQWICHCHVTHVQVCRRWHRLCGCGVLWRDHCLRLGKQEGLERLADALEALSGGQHVDWQQAYRQLSGVIKRVKSIVIKAG